MARPAHLRSSRAAWPGRTCDEAYRQPAPGALRAGRGGWDIRPAKDVVRMPPRRTFRDRAGYDATLAHEATHWTGHPKRLDRGLDNHFGNAFYARDDSPSDGSRRRASVFRSVPVPLAPRVRQWTPPEAPW
ncbi:MAG: zincin-like metallopeptidase domain-containing protein [Myxococcota bacterium]